MISGKRRALCIIFSTVLLMGCTEIPGENKTVSDISSSNEQYKQACTTPYGKYPELVTYTLGKMTGVNNSNMPEGDTYENNAYTRYLREMLNIQNEDVFEAIEEDYNYMVPMVIATKELPDIMIVTDIEDLEDLVENDLIEDLSTVYETCASKRIKEIYESYGSSILDNVTFDGKLMAIPETNIEDGPNLLWLRKDWMDKLGLEEPKTLDDVEYIIEQFIKEDPGNNGPNKTVGLLCDTNITGEVGTSYEYQMDTVFASFGAYPKQWIYDDSGNVVYGSIQKEAKLGLQKLNEWYEKGILDNQFLLRTTNNMAELVVEGKSGSLFGPWWTPNNPLMESMKSNETAEWVPYLIETEDGGVTSYYSQNPSTKYVVVRKGYEHPEIVVKVLNVLFDYVRYYDKSAQELQEYYQLNVDPTARPFVINVDYNNALSRCYEDLCAVIDGKESAENLQILEYSYYKSCEKYLSNAKDSESEDWAAYTSRITACSLLANGKTKKVESLFFGKTETMNKEWWKLCELEKKAYLEIVTGVKPLSYFDDFVEQWKESGGDTITEEVKQELSK